MKPINFKYSNKILTPSSKEYSTDVNSVSNLHIFTNGEQCVSCWKMSFIERIKAMIFGKVWIAILSGETQPPIFCTVEKEYLREQT